MIACIPFRSVVPKPDPLQFLVPINQADDCRPAARREFPRDLPGGHAALQKVRNALLFFGAPMSHALTPSLVLNSRSAAARAE